MGQCGTIVSMHIKTQGIGRTEHNLGASRFLCRAVSHDQKAIGI